jgi:hypothetical protein
VDWLLASAFLFVFFAGIVLGHVLAILYAHETLTRSGKIYKELVLRGDAAIAVLSRVKEEIAQLQGNNDRKRVVLASDLAGIRKVAGVPEAMKVEEGKSVKIVGG